MEQLYDTKTVIWSDRVEITKYANPIKVGQQIESRPRTPYEAMSPAEKQRSDERRIAYYRKRVRDLCALAVENDLRTFLTLTFAEPVTEYAPAKHQWELFLKRLKYAFPDTDLAYVAVHELQRQRATAGNKGVYHFHVLCNLGYCPIDKLQHIWGKGFCYIKQTPKGVMGPVLYLFKYITKDLLADEKEGIRTRHRKIYVSRNLHRPVMRKDLTAETFDDLIYNYSEKIESINNYAIKNHLGAVINHADCIIIKK